jgi:hypothetical protein
VKSRLLYQQTAFPKKLTIKILSAPGDYVPGLFNLGHKFTSFKPRKANFI